jgi:uncharacterized protein (DUF302 family)
MNYAYTKKIDFSYLEALDEVRLAFIEKWFWVVSSIDIWEKIRKKSDPKFLEYTVLWVCNPDLAHKFLTTKMDLGVFMPCSIAIYEKNGWVYVSVWLPNWMMPSNINSKELLDLSNKITKDIKLAIESI